MMSVETLANVILNNCDNISNKKIQKLSYYVYVWYLTIYNREIAHMSFEAWEHGPVCRYLYNKYKKYGWNVIPAYEGFVLASDGDIKFIQSVLNVYGHYTADELENMTHAELPWKEARNSGGQKIVSNSVISPDIMIQYYSTQTGIRNKILECIE